MLHKQSRLQLYLERKRFPLFQICRNWKYFTLNQSADILIVPCSLKTEQRTSACSERHRTYRRLCIWQTRQYLLLICGVRGTCDFYSSASVLHISRQLPAAGGNRRRRTLRLHKWVRNSAICAETTNEVLQGTLAQRHFAKLQLQKGWDSTQRWQSIMKPAYVVHGQTETPLHFRLITEPEITKKQWMEQHVVGWSRTGCELRPIEDFMELSVHALGSSVLVRGSSNFVFVREITTPSGRCVQTAYHLSLCRCLIGYCDRTWSLVRWGLRILDIGFQPDRGYCFIISLERMVWGTARKPQKYGCYCQRFDWMCHPPRFVGLPECCNLIRCWSRKWAYLIPCFGLCD